MALTSGSRIGAYEIVALLGAGGMGEVYRARDTRLERTVAIKVLPGHVASDPDRRARFEREARALAALSDPHICPVFDVGHDAGIDFLVMECLEGETLAARLQRGALPVVEAIGIAIQIAGALTTAHRAGIVHRDLKPGNVMLTKSGGRSTGSGQAKLLDFGLARTGGRAGVSRPDEPTMTADDAPLTARGTILGTFQYMAPEQIEGEDADGRADIFAFGCVLFEMVTGRKAFEGKSTASLMGAILKDDPPPVSQIAPVSPPILDRIVRTCLAKDPNDRFQDAHDLRVQLEWLKDGALAGTAAAASAPRSRVRQRLAWAVAAILLLAGGAALGRFAVPRGASVPAQELKLSLSAPDGARFTLFGAVGTPEYALSPDGRFIAFIATSGGRPPSLWIRALDSLLAQELPGTDDASCPFWSPDGERLGFFGNGKLQTIGIHDSRPSVLAAVPDGRWGGAWSRTGVILFGRNSGYLSRINATGGPIELAVPKQGGSHRWPQFLPDGRHFLYQDLLADGGAATFLGELGSSNVKVVFRGPTAVYADLGVLLFPRQGRLLAQQVNPTSWAPIGEPRVLLEQIGYAPGGRIPPVSLSENGLLAYWNGASLNSQLEWFDRSGQLLPSPAMSGSTFALSPDGRRIALTRGGDVWLVESSGSNTRFTFGGGNTPAWSADGRRVAYRTKKGFGERRADGVEGERPIDASPGQVYLSDLSPDGSAMVVHRDSASDPTRKAGDAFTGFDIETIAIATGKRTPLLRTPANEAQARFSQDGRWLAYTSDESGRWEVYVQPFPFTGAKHQVSVNGGSQPVWRRDGHELFFIGADARLMATSVKTSPTFAADTPLALFDTRIGIPTEPFYFSYATVDGQRFLINSVAPGSGATIGVWANWTQAVTR